MLSHPTRILESSKTKLLACYRSLENLVFIFPSDGAKDSFFVRKTKIQRKADSVNCNSMCVPYAFTRLAFILFH